MKAEFMYQKTPNCRLRTRHSALSRHLLLTLPLLAAITQLHGADIVIAANSAVANSAAPGTSSSADPAPAAPSASAPSEQPSVVAPGVLHLPSTPEKKLSASDQEITRALLSELLASRESSVAKKIKFQVLNGKVTLSGVAKNEKQKKAVFDMAVRAVGAANVEDKIQLRK